MLVCLVHLALFIMLFNQINETDRIDQTNDIRLADFFSILLDFPMPLRQERSKLLGRRLSAAEP